MIQSCRATLPQLEEQIGRIQTSLTDAEKTLILEMDKLRGEFNTITYNPTGNESDLKTGRGQVRTPTYGGTNLDPSLRSYTKVSRAEAAQMADSIKAGYAIQKAAIVETSKNLGKESALAVVDGIKKSTVASINAASKSASDSKEAKKQELILHSAQYMNYKIKNMFNKQ